MGGFAQNLIEGFAGAAGDQNTVNRIEKEKANRTALSHAELQMQTQSILDDVGGLQKRRAALDPKSPTYAADLADIDQNLHKARGTLTDLYHPANNPGALQHLGSFIKQHIGKQNGVPKTPAQAKESIGSTIAGLDTAAFTPGQSTAENPYADQIRNLEAVGVSHEDAVRSVREKVGLEAKETPTKFQPQLTTTTDAEGKQHYWRVPLEQGGKPEEVDFQGGKVVPKASGRDKYAWTKKNGKFVSVKLGPDGQIIPGSENPNILPPASLTGRISTGQYHYVDEKGQVHEIQETRTSMPAGQGGGIPKTAGEAKSRFNGPTTSPRDSVIGFKGNKDYQDTQTAYQGAVDRVKTMDQNLKNAQQGDQQAMLSLVANHIGMTLGAQRGARITQAVWNEAIDSTPWLSKVAAKWGPDGYLTGVTLAPEQMQQMVRLAHEKTQTLKEHLDRLNAARTDGGVKAATVQTSAQQFKVPTGAPPAPQQDGHKLKANGQVIAVSKGGQWVAP